ncbi:pyruvate, phosphate dikinase [Pseudonocardia sp.]|jgi:pyruvate,orthophosphate dikinase|uniref:pyruvate, phosphate dikinase n=1 Tax=Pseudonocardia sp. TaxID=60912 RepID=UPI0026294D4F|nr:pyruvate, phosphate dikinase [Pseudonocardia sp.]MCW2717317.1 pyruvate, phosphate dikinase [Pseudonocardia sp.]
MPLATAYDAPVEVLDGTSSASRDAIGGKAWSINRMRALGLPVPPAFAVVTGECARYVDAGRRLRDDLWERVVAGVHHLEGVTGRGFGDTTHPLLVSVRSGAATSMPGMMDTVLNLGITDAVEAALAAEASSPEYAADTHRRFRELYTSVVGGPVPLDPWEQLRAAICAVFDSWQSPRARTYRRHHGIADAGGTAVTVQAMVFGNLDGTSGTGVLFSRNPMTGEKPAYGEWLARGQGEDVVSGRCTPRPLAELADELPGVHAELLAAADTLERTGRDIQDIEFTVEAGRLWLLQSRVAKRAPAAAVRAAVDMVDAGEISPEEAVARVSADQVRTVLRPELDSSGSAEAGPVARGEPACPGLVTGIVVTDPDEAEDRADDGQQVILARATTSPDDLHGMIAAAAVVTEHGGSTSHAAVVSREIGRPCVVGCGPRTVTALAGRTVTVDGSTGQVWLGERRVRDVDEAGVADLARLVEWAAPLAPLRVHRAVDPLPPDADVVDLDAAGEAWRDALRADRPARGDVLGTDEGIAAAVAAGVPLVVVPFALPALLAALAATDTR